LDLFILPDRELLNVHLHDKLRNVARYPNAPAPQNAPIARGTHVRLDDSAVFLDREILSGGSPWRLLRLPGASASTAQQWRDGGIVGVGHETFARTLIQQGLLHPRYDVDIARDEVDVVIPVKDDLLGLAQLLTGLKGFHITVVDDGSSDAGALSDIVRGHSARLIRRTHSGGAGVARNEGVLATWRPFIWFLDADVHVDDAIHVARELLTHFSDPLVAAVAPRIQGTGGPRARDRFEVSHSPLDLGASSALVVPGARVSYVPSASLVVRRSAFGDGFDATLRIGEDVDFVWRLHDAGWLVRYDASVVVTHSARTSWREWWNQRESYGSSASELAIRHPGRLDPVRIDATTMAAWAAVAAFQPRAALALTSVARQRLRNQLPASVQNPDVVATRVVLGGIARSGAPLARSIVRAYLPGLVLLAVHPKTRAKAVSVLVIGTAARWRRHPNFRPIDVALAVADDAAYSVGLWRGALATRSVAAVRPRITGTTDGLRALIGTKKQMTPPSE
jgi:mycofactocin system glycosyltransferase